MAEAIESNLPNRQGGDHCSNNRKSSAPSGPLGRKRDEAAKKAGFSSPDEIETRIVNIDRIVKGEFHENQIRKDFTIDERVDLAEAISQEINENGQRKGRPKRRKKKRRSLRKSGTKTGFNRSPNLQISKSLPTACLSADRAGRDE